jgi:hypothetical protein
MNVVEWQLQPLARKSSASGALFEPGDRIVCFLIKSPSGDFFRADVRSDEAETYSPEGQVLGRWTRELKDSEDTEKASARQALQSSEELFLSLFDESLSEEAAHERDSLKQVLALMLERKRVLRSLGRPVGGAQQYLHVRTKKEYTVPLRELSAAELVAVHDQLAQVIV